MMSLENRFTLFGIMLWRMTGAALALVPTTSFGKCRGLERDEFHEH